MDPERRYSSRTRMERAVSAQTFLGVTTLRSSSTRVAATRPLRQYEFPTGFNTYYGPQRFQVGEEFFYYSPQLIVCLSLPFPHSDLTKQ